MAHKSVQKLFDELRENPDAVVVTDQEAASIYEFFMGYPLHPAQVGKPNVKAFLQAAMTGALDASNDIGWVQAIWMGTATPSHTLQQAISKIVRAVGKKLLTDAYSAEPKIYESVRNTIKWQQRSRFELITQTDDGVI